MTGDVWGDCPECGEEVPYEDIDTTRPTCPSCNTPLDDEPDRFEPDEPSDDDFARAEDRYLTQLHGADR